jgi:CheY-like chemotaxis protein
MSTIEQNLDRCIGIICRTLDFGWAEEVAMSDVRLKLLIVDDEVSIRESLSQLFSIVGYCVRSAEDGVFALSKIRQEIPDILLSDLNMPGMSGFELLPLVRRQFPGIHVIAMSGAFSGTRVPDGIVADAIFEKGSDSDILIKAVNAGTQPGRPVSRQQSMEQPEGTSEAPPLAANFGPVTNCEAA